MYSQLLQIFATCCIKFSLMNILQYCHNDFVAEPASGYTFEFYNRCNIKKKFCVASAITNTAIKITIKIPA